MRLQKLYIVNRYTTKSVPVIVCITLQYNAIVLKQYLCYIIYGLNAYSFASLKMA